MNSAVRHCIWIILIGIVVLFSNLGGPRLWDRDEPRNAGCTAEMLARGDWVTPVFNNELRTHKPILLYWYMMAAYALFGINEFAARFSSAAMAVGTALLTYGIGRRVFSARVGLWSGIILITTLMFDVAARAATPDSVLIFWSTASIFFFVWGAFPIPSAHEGGPAAELPSGRFPHWPVAVAMYACMGMAILAKGPIGLVLPTAVIGMYLLVTRMKREVPSDERHGAAGIVRRAITMVRPFAPRHFLRTCWSMRPVTALAVSLAVALPWYAMVWFRTDGQWVRGFLLDHNLGRATQSLEGHGGSLFYYPLALLVGFFPWSVFAAPTFLHTLWRARRRDTWQPGTILAICWIGVYVGLFSIARTKLPSYITPCYPAVALLVGSFVSSWADGKSFCSAFWVRLAFVCLAIVGGAVTVAVPLAASRYLPGDEWLGVLGLIPVVTAVAALVLLNRGMPHRAAIGFAVGAVLFISSLFAVGASRVDRHQTFDTLIATMHQVSRHPRLGALGVMEPSWVFYTRQPVDRLFIPDENAPTIQDARSDVATRVQNGGRKPPIAAWSYLRQSPDRFAITTEEFLAQLGELPDDIKIVARTDYFLKGEQLVLLGSNQHARQSTARRNQHIPAPVRR